jgi:ribose 5-phosphate isomerase B
MSLRVSIGCDHGGYELKNIIVKELKEEGIHIVDCGTDSGKSCDYPFFAHKTVGCLIDGEVDYSILICGSGQGMNMSANKWRSIRAALCWNREITELARLHNDANVLCLPGRFISNEDAIEMVKVFLSTDFEGGRHEARVNKIVPTL